MAFATKFKTTIQNWDGDTITAEIQEDGFAGTVQEFTPIGGSPITIEHQCNVNVKESYIIPSMASVGVYVNYDWDLVELLYAKDRDFRMVIKNGSAVLFTGWVIPGVNKEEYTTGRYRVMIQAIDGLADLKNIPYLNSGVLYDAYRYPSVIISDCLLATGITLGFWENCDIYAASGMTTTVTTHSPLNQSYIHTNAYGDSVDNVLSCFDVLEKVLQAFHLRLYQFTELDGGNNTVWVLGKIDKLDSTETYREWNSAGTTIASNTSYNPLKTLSTSADPRHIGGSAQISMQQGFKQVDIVKKRGQYSKLLNGNNFDSNDFNGSGVLTEWTNPATQWTPMTFTSFTANSAAAGGYIEATDGDRTVLSIANSSTTSLNLSINNIVGNGATATVTTNAAHGITTGWIITINGNSKEFDGTYIATSTGTFTFTIVNTANLTTGGGFAYRFELQRAMEQRVVYGGELSELTNDGLLELEIKARWLTTAPAEVSNLMLFGVYAQLGTGSGDDQYYYNSDKNGWHRGNFGEPGTTVGLVLIDEFIAGDYKTVKVEIPVSDMLPTSAELYVTIIEAPSGAGTIYIDSINIKSIKELIETKATTVIDTDYTEVLEAEIFHLDSDSAANHEYEYNTSIYDDASPKMPITSWKEDGGTADNLEDIIQANLVATYGDNSQIWSGTIKGDINISHAIKDPLNFDRIFQIQRIQKNLVNDFNSLSMIEITPAGEPTFALSISAPGTLEIDKGQDETGSKFATITNTGNALVSLSCVLSGGDTSHFEIIGATEFELPVGKSQVIELKAVTGDAVGGYASNIVISETRAYRTMTSKTIEIGHLNTNAVIQISNNVSNAQIISIVGGVNVINNKTGSTPNPTSKVITGIFGQNIAWQVQCVQIGPAGAGGTMRLSAGGPIVESRTLSNPSNLSVTITPDLHGYIESGAWNGAASLTYTLV